MVDVAFSFVLAYLVAVLGYHVVGPGLYNLTQRFGWRGFNIDD